MPAEVVIRNLSKAYGDVTALRDLSLDIESGEIFGLLGTNGAGKTTTVECLVGLRMADRGEILIGGVDVRRQSTEAKRRIGVVLQSTALPDQLTPAEALSLFGSLYGQKMAPTSLLDRFGLATLADRRFGSLSGGERQRLALALAFVNTPAVVVLDEPTNGLDAHSRRELHDEILRIKDEGRTVLLTTHDLAEAEKLCDRVAILDHGRLVAVGTPRELIARTSGHHRISVTTERALDGGALASLAGVSNIFTDGLTVRLSTSDNARTIRELLALLETEKIALIEIQSRRATLEEVFLSLIRDGPVNSSTHTP
jgi:ABC-2 type transport system ATP-binding protein